MQKLPTLIQTDPQTSPSDSKNPPDTKTTYHNHPYIDKITIKNIAKMFGFR